MKNKIIENLNFVIGLLTLVLVVLFVEKIKIVCFIAGGGLTLYGLLSILKKENTGYIIFSTGVGLLSTISLYTLEILDKVNSITFMVCFTLALMLIIAMIFSVINAKKIIQTFNLQVIARVIDLEKNPNTKKEYYQPIYQYEVEGKSYTVGFPGYKDKFIPKIGDTLKIYVDPNDHLNVYFDKSLIEKIYNYGLNLFLIIASIIIIITLFI